MLRLPYPSISPTASLFPRPSAVGPLPALAAGALAAACTVSNPSLPDFGESATTGADTGTAAATDGSGGSTDGSGGSRGGSSTGGSSTGGSSTGGSSTGGAAGQCGNGLVEPGEDCATMATITLPAPAWDLASADLEDDGDLDLVAACKDIGRAVVVELDAGAEVGQTEVLVGTPPTGILFDDFTQDQVPDLVSVGEDGTYLVEGDGAGGFGVADQIVDYGWNISATDVSPDGRRDILIHEDAGLFVPTKIVHMVNQGGGNFLEMDAFPNTQLPFYVSPLLSHDVDGDGLADIVHGVLVNSSPELRVALAMAPGTYDYPPGGISLAGGPGAGTVHDANDDDNIDVAVALLNQPQIEILRGTGGGAFGLPAMVDLADVATHVAAGDVDGDGKEDLVVGYASGGVDLLRRTGPATYETLDSFAGASAVEALHLADLDGDGVVDVAAAFDGDDDVTLRLSNH